MPDTDDEEQPLQHQQSQSYQTIILPTSDDDNDNDQERHFTNSSYNNHQHKPRLGNISLPILTLWYINPTLIMLANQPTSFIT